jgi:hypothetical protein
MTKLNKRVQLTNTRRSKLARDITARYVAGASIRDLADYYGRSYGFVHRVVFDSGTPLRNRGGSYRLAGARPNALTRDSRTYLHQSGRTRVV